MRGAIILSKSDITRIIKAYMVQVYKLDPEAVFVGFPFTGKIKSSFVSDIDKDECNVESENEVKVVVKVRGNW